MNRYGAMAQAHWARWLPQRYATISDPDSFFSTLGQETEQQIDDLATELAGDDQPGEDYVAKAGRLTAARSQAEEVILPQRVLPPPETGENQSPEEDGHPAPGTGRPAAISPDHPMWAEVNAEQRERLGLDG